MKQLLKNIFADFSVNEDSSYGQDKVDKFYCLLGVVRLNKNINLSIHIT